MKRFLSATLLTLPVFFAAQAESYLIENVRIFNGVDPELMAGHVLVEDGVIASGIRRWLSLHRMAPRSLTVATESCLRALLTFMYT